MMNGSPSPCRSRSWHTLIAGALLAGLIAWATGARAQSNVTLVAPRVKVTANVTFTFRANHAIDTFDLIAYQCFLDGTQVGMDIPPSINTDGTIDCTIPGGVPAGNHDVSIGALYDSVGLLLARLLPILAV